jgi:hypothetical protein
MSPVSDDVYPKKRFLTLACWLGGKRNHFDTGGLNIKTAGMVHMNVIWLVVPPCLSHAILLPIAIAS